MNSSKIKEDILIELTKLLKSKIDAYQSMIDSISESKSGDTKSSAGDKFETSREMMQMELDKAEDQLIKSKHQLMKIETLAELPASRIVQAGSLVACNSGCYYISIGYGTLTLQGKKYYVISPISPIGQLLLSHTIGDELPFRGQKISIIDIA